MPFDNSSNAASQLWVLRFNQDGREGLVNREGAGRPRLLSDEQMQKLAQIVETGPNPKADGVVRWRRIDLVRIIDERFGVTCSKSVISDYLAALGFSHISVARSILRKSRR